MQGQNLSNICNSVISFFKKTAKQIGKTTKFVERKSKLNAILFVESLVTGCLSNSTITLEKICELLKKRGVKISKQGLHERFNEEATGLLRQLFGVALQKFKTESDGKVAIDLLKQFSSVKLMDSSNVALPDNLKTAYPGYGGDAAKAALKIQLLFNYTNNQIEKAWITEAKRNDQGFKEHLNIIENGALHLQDLGYFKVGSFQTIHDNGAYFISKYLSPTAIFSKDKCPLNLLKELHHAEGKFSKEILLGTKNKLPVRLIAFKLSKEDAQKRIRRIKGTAKRQGYTPKKITLQLAQWSIFVTNVPKNMLNDEQVYLVYSLRWQIELFFKLCKSEAGLDKMNSKKFNRVLCEIYAKLICIVMLMHICFPIRWKVNQEISLRKAYKQLSMHAVEFLISLKSPYRLLKFLKEYIDNSTYFAFKDKRKKTKVHTYQKLIKTTKQEALA